MIHSVRFTAVLDTCVLYPLLHRDILLWFASHQLFTPKWTKHICDEWYDVMKRKGISENKINKRIAYIDDAFPDARVLNYEKIISFLQLPDDKDRHVLAAAIKTNANVIVTSNLKDFPEDVLTEYGLSSKSPDDFLVDTIDLNPKTAVIAFREMVSNRSRPTIDEFELLTQLRRNGLYNTADYLHSQL